MTTTIDQKLILYAQLCISWMRNNFQHIMELYNTDTYPQASSPHVIHEQLMQMQNNYKTFKNNQQIMKGKLSFPLFKPI